MIRVLHLSRPSLTCARRSALGSALATCVCLMVGSNFFLFFTSQLSSRDITSHADHSANAPIRPSAGRA